MTPIYYSNRPHPLLVVVGAVIIMASLVALAAVLSVAAERAIAPRDRTPSLSVKPDPQTVAQPENPPPPDGQAG